MRKVIGLGVVVVLVGLVLLGLASRRPREGGWVKERLAPCSSRPNCVSSRDPRPSHRVEPLATGAAAADAFRRAAKAVRALPRTRIVVEEDGYLHAECASALFRFVDDLELQLDLDPEADPEADPDTGAGVLHVRSTSRIGYGDLGANRRRVERLRAALAR